MSCAPLLHGDLVAGAPAEAAAADEVVVAYGAPQPSSDLHACCKVCLEEYPCQLSRRRHLAEGGLWLGTPLLLGLILGLTLPTDDSKCPAMPTLLSRLSTIIGWTYFCAWSISFYPQAYLNYRRKSVVGLSLDFQLLNLLGFGCYAAYNAALFWDPTVRREYSCLNGGALPAVHANDVFFALHAFVVTAATLVQCALYDRGGQKISWPAALGAGGAAASIAAYLAAVIGAAVEGGGGSSTLADGVAPGASCGSILSWLSFLYFLSYIKLGVSLVKYIPQVWLNYRRQSTEGWNMHNVLLDFGGGALSLVQLVMDGAATRDWSAVTGNPVKFGLGSASMLFDVVFMAQHWLLYPAAARQQPSFWEALEACRCCKAGERAGSSTAAAHDHAEDAPERQPLLPQGGEP